MLASPLTTLIMNAPRSWAFATLLATVMLAPLACGDDDAATSAGTGGAAGGGGATGVGGSDQGSGGSGECVLSTDCPGEDNQCSKRSCVNQKCSMKIEASGTSCDSGGTVCDGKGSCVGCLIDQDCPGTDDYCADDNSCLPQLASAEPCTGDNSCQSGSCSDGVCCDNPCSGVCEACVLAKTGAADGTCAPISSGTDPDDDCPGTQLCDGAGSCAR